MTESSVIHHLKKINANIQKLLPKILFDAISSSPLHKCSISNSSDSFKNFLTTNTLTVHKNLIRINKQIQFLEKFVDS